MRNKKKMLALLLSATMLAFACTGCKKEEPNAGKTEGVPADTIVYALGTSPSGDFFPYGMRTAADTNVYSLVYASLLTSDGSGEYEPYLADRYEISDDELTYTFYLNENAVWSDGEPVTANDVAFSFMVTADPENEQLYATMAQTIAGVAEYQAGTADTISGINIIDDHTISFTTTSVSASSLSYFGLLSILPEHIWEGNGYRSLDEYTGEEMTYVIGCGPYSITEFEEGSYTKFEANEDFFLGTPVTKNIYFQVLNDSTASSELSAGTVDIAPISSLSDAELTDLESKGFTSTSFAEDSYNVLFFTQGNTYPTEFRQAIAYALDRQSMVDTLMDGRGTVCNMLMTPASWAYPSDGNFISYDEATAKEKLEEAGYKDTNGDGYVENPDGSELTLRFAYPTGIAVREQSAVVIQENLKSIGLNVELMGGDFNTISAYIMDGACDIYMMGISNDTPDPDCSMWAATVGTVDEDFATLCMAASATTDQNERKEIYKDAAEQLAQSAALIPLYCMDSTFVYPETLENYNPGTFNNFYEVYKWALYE